MFTLINLYHRRLKARDCKSKGEKDNRKKNTKLKSVPDEKLNTIEKTLRKISFAILYSIEMSVNIMVSYWLPPVYYAFFMIYIRSRVVANSGIMRDLLEIPFTLYAITNITGNFLMHKFKDVSLQAYAKKEDKESYQCPNKSGGAALDMGVNFCKKCNMYQVANSWHCTVCDKCIMWRDYHCFVLSQCVTRQNKRFYILGLFYASGAIVYTSVYALLYQCEDNDLIIFETIPILGNLFVFDLIYSQVSHLVKLGCWISCFVLFINIFLFVIAFGMFVVNLKWAIQRTTYWETKARERGRLIPKNHVFEPTKHPWLQIVEEVLGERWYLAFFCPFVNSPLPRRARIDLV